jgi:aspartate-semialdehyde dehydrogenase
VSRGAEPIVVVAGATGVVGEEVLAVLAERRFPAAAVRALASPASAGLRVAFGDGELAVRAVADDAFAGAGVAFLCASAAVSERYAARLAAAGALVVDLSDRFATVPEVPLLVPEVNLRALVARGGARLVSVGGVAAGALAAVLAPLDAAAALRAVTVTTFEPASTLGRPGVAELGEQAAALLGGREADARVFPSQIAFNCIPAVGALDAAGHAHAEGVLRHSLRRILDRPTLAVAATAVHVPTFFGFGAAVTVELERALAAAAAHAVLREAPSLMVAEGERYATTFGAVGSDAVHVARIREHGDRPGSLGLWVAVDNTRKAAAINAVVIAEALLRSA